MPGSFVGQHTEPVTYQKFKKAFLQIWTKFYTKTLPFAAISYSSTGVIAIDSEELINRSRRETR